MKGKILNFYGWYGAVAIVAAYALVSFSVISPNSLWYQLLNGSGALGIVLVSFERRAYQPAFLNVVWLVVALAAIVKILV
jgi:hypothetical protein